VMAHVECISMASGNRGGIAHKGCHFPASGTAKFFRSPLSLPNNVTCTWDRPSSSHYRQ
jgi:hypothetical protein